ncbi:MAG: cyanophycin synthetase, partial [Atribacterota bacterium]
FGNVESLVQEKIQLAVPPVDVVYLNLDNPYGEEVKNTLRDRGIPVITYGFENHEKRDLALVSFEVDPASGVSSFHCRLRTDYHSFQVPFFSPELMVMLLPALQFSLQQGISELDIQDALNGMVLPDGREKVYRLRQGYVIDDSYNANPVSMQKALSLLELFHRWGYRTWAVLGDMLEMGSVSESAHQNLIRSFDQHRVNTIILYGPMMREAAERVVSSGQLQGECYLAYSHDEIQKILLDQVEKQGEKWVVLFKGSRGMQMEKAIPAEWRSKHGTL